MSDECDKCGEHTKDCNCKWERKQRRITRLNRSLGVILMLIGITGVWLLETKSWDEIARKSLSFLLGLGLSHIYDRLKKKT